MSESILSRFPLAGWILLGFFVLAGAGGAVYHLLASGGMEEALRLDDLLKEAIADATDGRYDLELDGMTVSPRRGVLLLHNVRLLPAPGFTPPDSAYHLTFSAPEVRLDGVEGWRALVQGEVLTAGTVRFERPEIRLVRPADGRSYWLALDAVRFEIAAGNAVMRGIRLVGDSTSASVRFTLSASEARVDRIDDWRRLVYERILTADSLRIVRPKLHLFASDSTAPADTTTAALHARLARALRDVRLACLAIDDASVSYTRIGLPSGSADTLRALTLRLSDFDVEAGAGRLLFSEAVDVELGRYERSLADGRYLLTAGPLRASSTTRRLEIDSLSISPALSHVAMMRQLGHRKGLYDTAARSVALSEFDLHAWVEEGDFVADAMDIDGFQFTYADDMRWPDGPRRRGPRLPHELFRAMERSVRIDTLRIQSGQVRYRRFAADGERPGTLRFDRVYATIYNVSNDPQRMNPSTPAVVYANARLARSGRLRLTMRYNLLTSDARFGYRGELTDLNAPALNEIFVPVQGVELRAGQIDSLRFAVQVRGGRAQGTLESRYRDLHVRLVDKGSGDQNLGRRLRSFVADRRVRTNNPVRQGRAPYVGTIAHTYVPNDSFFRFLWLSLRSGITSVTGIDRW